MHIEFTADVRDVTGNANWSVDDTLRMRMDERVSTLYRRATKSRRQVGVNRWRQSSVSRDGSTAVWEGTIAGIYNRKAGGSPVLGTATCYVTYK